MEYKDRLKYSKILKPMTDCFGLVSSGNFGSDNKVYIGGNKHRIMTIEKVLRVCRGKEINRKKLP